jgi:hypothetical protein
MACGFLDAAKGQKSHWKQQKTNGFLSESRNQIIRLTGRFSVLLTECEVKSLDAAIEEFDLKRSVYDCTFLPDELIESRLSNFAGAVRSGIRSTIFARGSAIQGHFKTDGLAVLCWGQNQVQVAAVEPEHNLARPCLEHGGLGTDIP